MYPFGGRRFYDIFYFWDIFISNCWLFFYPLQIRHMIFLLPSSHFSSLFSHFSYGLLLPLPLLISSFSSFSTTSAFSSSLSFPENKIVPEVSILLWKVYVKGRYWLIVADSDKILQGGLEIGLGIIVLQYKKTQIKGFLSGQDYW